MNSVEIGKLYKSSKYILLIYPDLQKARKAENIGASGVARATWNSKKEGAINYWSRKLNCKIHASEPNEPFMIIDVIFMEGVNFFLVLCGEKQGWIIFKHSLEIEKLN